MNKLSLDKSCRIKGGSGFPEIYQGDKDGIYPFIKVSDMSLAGNSKYIQYANNYVDESLVRKLALTIFPKNTVVFAKVGAAVYLNKRRMLIKETIIDNNMMGLIPEDIDPEFLYQFMLDIDLAYFVQPGALPSINQEIVSGIEYPGFEIKEQQKIAKILTTVDSLIEKTEALIEKYQAIKQGMMHDLFTRGIDTNGQLRPSHTDAPHLYKQTELGWIPKEWGAKTLGDVAVKIQDGTHFSPQTTEGEYLYLTSKNIRFGYLDLENIERISIAEHNSIYTRCDVKYGDLLLTKDGANTGNAALNTIKEPFSMLSSVAFIRLDGVSAHADFLLHYLLSLIGQKRMKDQMSGNAITRLTLTKINNFLVLQPPGSEQRLIADRLNSIKIKIESEEDYAQKLMANKKGLMQDLLTGKVRLKVD